MGTEFWPSEGKIPDILGGILSWPYNILRYENRRPFHGKMGMSAYTYEMAAPVVSDASQKAIEAGTP